MPENRGYHGRGRPERGGPMVGPGQGMSVARPGILANARGTNAGPGEKGPG